MTAIKLSRAALQGRSTEAWLLAVLAIGFGPVLYELANNEWARADSGQGPIVLALSGYLFAKAWLATERVQPPAGTAGIAWLPVLVVAAAGYFIGFVGEISQVAYGSLLVFLTAAVLGFQPTHRWKAFIFPILFLFFSIPLPGFIVDPITMPMKLLVSTITENILYAAGYPISRTGVILNIGPYQLLVADACAGLRTLFTLEALGLLYLNMVEYASPIRNVGLAVLIVPISIIANTLRVIILCLVTYHLGDEAGQGFLHEFAGLVLFMFGLVLLLLVDGVLRGVSRRIHLWKAVQS
jgi:exosortase B